MYNVLVIYKGGPNWTLDDELAQVARVKSVGSGYDFNDRERDVQFVTDRKSTAINVVKRLRATIKKAHVRGRVVAYKGKEFKKVRLY